MTQGPSYPASCSSLLCQLVPVTVKFVVYPIDRARILIQTQCAPGVIQGEAQFRGVWQSLKYVCQTEGWKSPWRGFATTCLRWAPYQCLNLAAFDFISGSVPAYSREKHPFSYFSSKLFIGALAGVGSAAVWGYPLDVVRQHLATHNAVKPASAVFVIQRIRREQGFLGFYRGFSAGCAGLAIFRAVQLGGWDIVKEW
eukprot:CAMPEP_0169386944 /NCGR_PEP_ID=MMETSP1017-20121227/45070_1 /TAXON_ID=342587 /ORGANISM="Karlodinium micrum, Strain CCMP2283" /LENGTH=197 /DNA_ID=CAMNT_0009488281 /DNA_START=16 /DNA_END=606 /DNA_ORIENTATION=-